VLLCLLSRNGRLYLKKIILSIAEIVILMLLLYMFSIDDEPPGDQKGGGDFTKNVAASVTTINSLDDAIDDGEIS